VIVWFVVMAGLIPAIHDFLFELRDKPGHDG